MFLARFPKDLGSAVLLLAGLCLCVPASGQTDKPKVLIIWGDDVGMWNISAYHRGMMGGSTPNTDRIANDGMIFVDHYAQESCTAGRAAVITGQCPIRSGMTTLGQPGDALGLQAASPVQMGLAESII
jgi:arylsulfatase